MKSVILGNGGYSGIFANITLVLKSSAGLLKLKCANLPLEDSKARDDEENY
ncbi:MAG TPA: hypothetical protein VIV35_03310 [Chitinophagaceae bacterium]